MWLDSVEIILAAAGAWLVLTACLQVITTALFEKKVSLARCGLCTIVLMIPFLTTTLAANPPPYQVYATLWNIFWGYTNVLNADIVSLLSVPLSEWALGLFGYYLAVRTLMDISVPDSITTVIGSVFIGALCCFWFWVVYLAASWLLAS